MWTNEKCVMLISLYESKRVLWDAKYEQYFNKQKKADAWRSISISMEIDVDEIKKKMTSLLGSFRRERSKVKRSMTTGKGTYWSLSNYILYSSANVMFVSRKLLIQLMFKLIYITSKKHHHLSNVHESIYKFSFEIIYLTIL